MNIKKILTIISGIVLFFSIAGATVLLLKTLNTDNSQLNNTKSLNSVEVIKMISSSNIFNVTKFTAHPNGEMLIGYKTSEKNYQVLATTKETLGYYLIKNQTNNRSTTENSIKSLFTKNGLVKTSTDNKGTTTEEVYTNIKSVCKLEMSYAVSIRDSYRIGCVNMNDITNAYKSIDKLMTIYKRNQKQFSFNDANIQTSNKDNISYSILTLYTKKNSATLLFASVNNVWEYLGKLTLDDKGTSISYKMSDELRLKISDSKYKGFLTSEML